MSSANQIGTIHVIGPQLINRNWFRLWYIRARRVHLFGTLWYIRARRVELFGTLWYIRARRVDLFGTLWYISPNVVDLFILSLQQTILATYIIGDL